MACSLAGREVTIDGSGDVYCRQEVVSAPERLRFRRGRGDGRAARRHPGAGPAAAVRLAQPPLVLQFGVEAFGELTEGIGGFEQPRVFLAEPLNLEPARFQALL